MKKLSVVVATYNEEANLKWCLLSVNGFADEIILVDAKSSDKTIEIAKSFKVKIFSIENQPMFHLNKQYGMGKAKFDWVLQLDADEAVSYSLKQEILEILKQDNLTEDGYYLPRINYFLGKPMKKGGLYPDGVIRLVKNKKAKFPCKDVHEQIEVYGKVGWLKNPLLHYPYPNLTSYYLKADRYTTLTASDLKKKGVRKNLHNTLKFYLYHPLVTFINIFIRHQGFRDGWRGFLWAFLSSRHYSTAYSKLINSEK